mgnify:FL=1
MFRLELFLFASILIQLILFIGLNKNHNPPINHGRLSNLQAEYKKTR